MQSLFAFIQSINQFLWSGPLLFLLMGTHLYFTMKLHFPQKNIFKAVRLSVTPAKNAQGANLSVFATLSTTLAATLGTGNIIGVSTAVALGGPGAIFWCWVTGILGMATADRKSTRLNSSHANISYAVFCLKKKTWLLRSVFSSCCLARDFGLLPGWDTALPWSSAVLDW